MKSILWIVFFLFGVTLMIFALASPAFIYSIPLIGQNAANVREYLMALDWRIQSFIYFLAFSVVFGIGKSYIN